MESKYRTENQIYKSKKILGMLYDQVKLVDFEPQYENAFDSRILDAFKLEEAILDEAARLKESYDSSLKRMMAKHAIRTEFEAWSVFVLSHNQESRDYTFVQDFGVVVQILKDSTREACIAASSKYGGLTRFVAAMYTITAKEMEEALKECRKMKIVAGMEVPMRKMDPESMPLMSFPWVFYNQLGKIATGDRPDRQPDRKLDKLLQSAQRQHKKHVDADIDLDPALTAEAESNVETNEGVLRYGELLKLDFSPWGPSHSLSVDSETRSSADSAVKEPPSEINQPYVQPTARCDNGGYQGLSRSAKEQTDTKEIENGAEVKVQIALKPSAIDRLKNWNGVAPG
jgi:RNA-dependent RNA polymerase